MSQLLFSSHLTSLRSHSVKKCTKTLVLAFEPYSAASLNCIFFLILDHCGQEERYGYAIKTQNSYKLKTDKLYIYCWWHCFLEGPIWKLIWVYDICTIIDLGFFLTNFKISRTWCDFFMEPQKVLEVLKFVKKQGVLPKIWRMFIFYWNWSGFLENAV